MHWVIQFIVRYRTFTSLSLTVLLSLLMLSSSSTQQIAIARTLTVTIFFPVQLVLSQATRITNIFSENQKLRQRVTELDTQLVLLQEAARENARLRAMIDFKQSSSYDLVPARAVARDLGQRYRSVIIDAGVNKGIALAMPVVTDRGLVGKIVGVYGHMSLVQLLRDGANRTSVMTTTGRQVGILETDNGSSFFVRYRSDAEVQPGDTLITSGFGGVYPRGLSVGTIEKINPDNQSLFKRAGVHMAVDFEKLEELFVLRMDAQWQSFREQQDSVQLEISP
jgi:rod shape-determining protein MreC